MEGVSEHTDTGDSAQLTKPALLQRKAAQAPTQGGGGGTLGVGPVHTQCDQPVPSPATATWSGSHRMRGRVPAVTRRAGTPGVSCE